MLMDWCQDIIACQKDPRQWRSPTSRFISSAWQRDVIACILCATHFRVYLVPSELSVAIDEYIMNVYCSFVYVANDISWCDMEKLYIYCICIMKHYILYKYTVYESQLLKRTIQIDHKSTAVNMWSEKFQRLANGMASKSSTRTLNSLSGLTKKKPFTVGFPSQEVSNGESVSISKDHVLFIFIFQRRLPPSSIERL